MCMCMNTYMHREVYAYLHAQIIHTCTVHVHIHLRARHLFVNSMVMLTYLNIILHSLAISQSLSVGISNSCFLE